MMCCISCKSWTVISSPPILSSLCKMVLKSPIWHQALFMAWAMWCMSVHRVCLCCSWLKPYMNVMQSFLVVLSWWALQCISCSVTYSTATSKTAGFQASYMQPLALRSQLCFQFQVGKIWVAVCSTFFNLIFISNKPIIPTLFECKKILTSSCLVGQLRSLMFQQMTFAMRWWTLNLLLFITVNHP